MEIFTGVDAKFVRGKTFGVIRVQYSSDCGVIRITMFFRLGIDNGRNMSHTKLIVSIEKLCHQGNMLQFATRNEYEYIITRDQT